MSTHPSARDDLDKGERFEATIWSGEELGIRIGVPNRDRFFSRKNDHVVLIIDDNHYSARIPNSFWSKCPEIRVASDSQHFNVLQSWIESHGLQPQSAAKALHGKKDTVMLEVVEPEVAFRLMVPPPQAREAGGNKPEPPTEQSKLPPAPPKARPGPIQEQWKARLPPQERPFHPPPAGRG